MQEALARLICVVLEWKGHQLKICIYALNRFGVSFLYVYAVVRNGLHFVFLRHLLRLTDAAH